MTKQLVVTKPSPDLRQHEFNMWQLICINLINRVQGPQVKVSFAGLLSTEVYIFIILLYMIHIPL